MVRVRKSKHVVAYKNIFDEFNVEQCEIKINVTITPAEFNHLVF